MYTNINLPLFCVFYTNNLKYFSHNKCLKYMKKCSTQKGGHKAFEKRISKRRGMSIESKIKK